MMLHAIAKAVRKVLHKQRRAQAGETLVETLVAVLVATFAALTLMMSVATAATINARAEATDRALAADQLAVESRDLESVGVAQAQARIVADDGSLLGTYDVDVYEGDEGKYRSYGKVAQ